MKNYDPNIIYEGVHTIEITIQQWDYVGHIVQKIGGDCKGREILDFDFECEGTECLENDCQLKYNEEFDLFSAVLKSENGDTLEIEEEAEDFNRMIVKIEILNYEQKKKIKGEKKHGSKDN